MSPLLRYGASIPLASLLAACHPAQQPATETTVPTQQTAVAFTPPAGPLRSADAEHITAQDTLRTPQGVVYVRPITQAAFEQARQTDLLSEFPSGVADASLAPSHGRIRREGGNLLFRPAQGPTLILHDSTLASKPADEEYPNPIYEKLYHYWGSLSAAGPWVVYRTVSGGAGGQGKESDSSGLVLLDQHSGRRTELGEGYPARSPDQRYVVLVHEQLAMMSGGYDGLELYQLAPTGPRVVWQRVLQHGGWSRARWAGPRTLLLERKWSSSPRQPEATERRSTYCQLQLPVTE